MGRDLRMEVFASKDVVKLVSLHIYQLHSQKIDNSFSVIRGAVWKLKNYNHVGVFEDGNRIYSTDMLDGSIPNAVFTIEYEGIRELEVLENRKIYCELIKYLITKNLSEVLINNEYRKYSCKSSVTSKWIKTDNDFNLFTSDNKEISLERKYNFWVDIMDDGNVDCFVGLDVATVAKGIHYPACSVVFDKYGCLLGFYKPTTPQQGEKITTRILQDIFDQVIFSYEDRFGESPKNVVIHRDGFSNEKDEWYKNYFGAKGIEYSIIEVRKNISSKLILIQDGNIENPTMGYCVYNNSKGYLVTTDMKNKKGSPNPILVEKKCGNISMADVLTQILYLSQLHVGSTHKMRLPITTGYADKICKNRDFIPEGKMDDRLFFL